MDDQGIIRRFGASISDLFRQPVERHNRPWIDASTEPDIAAQPVDRGFGRSSFCTQQPRLGERAS